MANKQRFNFLQNQRVDVPHLKAGDDAILFDFKNLLQAFVSDAPYVLRGFNITNASNYINSQAATLQVTVADSVVWMPGDGDGSFLNVPAGTANETMSSSNAAVSGSFTSGATNYISLVLTRATDSSTNDLVSFWDVDAKVEFTKTVPTGLVLNYQFVINASGFGTNLPIAIVDVNSAGSITRITNAKTGLFRLGSGGLSPNILNSPGYTIGIENPLTVTANGQADPFAGADWEISNWKSWMDHVMQMFKNITGSPFWYTAGSVQIPNINLTDLAFDSNYSVMTGSGAFIHSSVTPGLLTWTSDLNIRSIFGPLTMIISQGSAALSDKQVAYIQLQRNVNFQSTNVFTFANGSTSVSAVNTVTGIVAGDWIKFVSHDISRYAQVASVVANVVNLTAPYAGASAAGVAVKTTGRYTIQTADPVNVPVDGSTYWLAKRDDNAFTPLLVDTILNSGLTRSTDISTAKTVAAHGLSIGQAIAIAGASDASFDGTFNVLSVPSPTTFTFNNPGVDVAAASAGGGIVSAVAEIYLRGRGGNGELQQGEQAQIEDTTIWNVLQFIGATSETDIAPPYTQLPSPGTPFQFNASSNLTQAVSALTGNMNATFAAFAAPAYDEVLSIVSAGAFTQINNAGAPTAIGIMNQDIAIAYSFVAGANGLLNQLQMSLKIALGTPICNLQAVVWSDSAGAPGSVVANSTTLISASSLTSTYSTQTFNFAGGSLVNGQTYWVGLKPVSITTLDSMNGVAIAEQTPATGSAGQAVNPYTTWSTTPSYTFVGSLTTGGAIGTNQVAGPLAAGSILTLPLQSRTGNTPQYYPVGKGYLKIYLNGQLLALTSNVALGWTEVGTAGNPSNQIQIDQQLFVGDTITFSISGIGGPGSGAGAADDNFYTLATSTNVSGSNYVLIYDVVAGGYRKQSRSTFLSGLGNTLVYLPVTSNTLASTATDVFGVDCTLGPINLALPPAASATGKVFYIAKQDSSANAVTIQANGAELITGSNTLIIGVQYKTYTIYSNGLSWMIL